MRPYGTSHERNAPETQKCTLVGSPHLYDVCIGRNREIGQSVRYREEHHMIDTHETVITEALAVIDKALAEMLRRELVSAVEVGDLLLDLRGLLTASVATTVAAV